MATKAPRGTKDLLGEEVSRYQYIEETARGLFSTYCYDEIRTPIFEFTEVFVRGIGEETDIVSKEMYTFPDRRGRSLTLRPEGTAGVVRALIERKQFSADAIAKLYYIGPMFRYERPQKGRERQFSQIGLEFFGSPHPAADAEIIALSTELLREIGFLEVATRVNTLGCRDCRKEYLALLKERLRGRMDSLCEDCIRRADSNPMRVFDCKNESCREALREMPVVSEHVCEECSAHFSEVQRFLVEQNIPFEQSPSLVRGFDYYTRTVFETTLPGLGSQDSVLGGGRYDNLVEDLGGPNVPAVGMSFGIERIVIAMEACGALPTPPEGASFFVIAMEEDSVAFAAQAAYRARSAGLKTYFDYSVRSVKSGLRAAGKKNFTHALIIGKNEVDQRVVEVKNLIGGDQKTIPLDDIGTLAK